MFGKNPLHTDYRRTRLAVAAGVELKDVVRDQFVVMNNFFEYVKRIVEGRQ